jgi:hypothetical protein
MSGGDYGRLAESERRFTYRRVVRQDRRAGKERRLASAHSYAGIERRAGTERRQLGERRASHRERRADNRPAAAPSPPAVMPATVGMADTGNTPRRQATAGEYRAQAAQLRALAAATPDDRHRRMLDEAAEFCDYVADLTEQADARPRQQP